jgi:DNA-binding LytR/AlgR family response regulator
VRCLIADDEPLARAKVKKLLLEVGCEVVSEHADGESVLEWVQANPGQADAAFLDIRMPRASGLEVAEALGESLPVVFITGFKDYALNAFELAAVDYLEKPINADKVARVLERIRKRIPLTRYRGTVPTITVRTSREVRELVPITCIESLTVSQRDVWARINGVEEDHAVLGFRTLREIEAAYPLEEWHYDGRSRLTRGH